MFIAGTLPPTIHQRLATPLGVVKSIHHVLPRLKSDMVESPYVPLATLAEVEHTANANRRQDPSEDVKKAAVQQTWLALNYIHSPSNRLLAEAIVFHYRAPDLHSHMENTVGESANDFLKRVFPNEDSHQAGRWCYCADFCLALSCSSPFPKISIKTDKIMNRAVLINSTDVGSLGRVAQK